MLSTPATPSGESTGRPLSRTGHTPRGLQPYRADNQATLHMDSNPARGGATARAHTTPTGDRAGQEDPHDHFGSGAPTLGNASEWVR